MQKGDSNITAARPDNLDDALDHLERDGLVAFPTETVWGLAARAQSSAAVANLMSFKGRAAGQPVSVLIDDAERLAKLGVAEGPVLRALTSAFWPGPLTIVAGAPVPDPFAPGICGPDGGVGFRCSDHPLAALLVGEAFRRGLGPLTATSFNRSGKTAVENFPAALLLASESDAPAVIVLVPGALDASRLPPSTVLDIRGEAPKVLRQGAVEPATLRSVLDRF